VITRHVLHNSGHAKNTAAAATGIANDGPTLYPAFSNANASSWPTTIVIATFKGQVGFRIGDELEEFIGHTLAAQALFRFQDLHLSNLNGAALDWSPFCRNACGRQVRLLDELLVISVGTDPEPVDGIAFHES
jgi:hypothetical protein